MSRDFYDLSVEDRNKLKLIAANSNYLQNVKGYDDYYMAENVWGVKVDTYDDYKLYGPGKAVLRFCKWISRTSQVRQQTSLQRN